MPGHLDRARVAALCAERGIDALVLTQPESIRYAAGAGPGLAASWRRRIAAAVLVPADPGVPLAAVVGDLDAASFGAASGIADVRTHRLWVDTATVPHGDPDAAIARLASAPPAPLRPGTFDQGAVLAQLRDQLAERGLVSGRIGIEADALPAADALALSAALPGAILADGSDLLRRLRAIKSTAEAALLHRAALLAEAGLIALRDALRPGLNEAALNSVWRAGVAQAAASTPGPAPESSWAYIAVGPHGFGPGGVARRGDVVKADVGCVIQGYSSDGARTFVLGPPDRAQGFVFDALRQGFDAGLALLRPGTRLPEVYRATLGAIHEAGLPGFARGHVGHGLGASVWSEEWPFIAQDCDEPIAPGMVLAFEAPFYVEGLGAFMVEDQFAIGQNEVTPAMSLSRALMTVDS